MSAAAGFPALLERFFTERLLRQRQASPHTVASYRDTFSLLLRPTWSPPDVPPLTLAVAVILPLMAAVTVFFQRRMHPIFVEVRKLMAEICARLAEFIQGMQVLQDLAGAQRKLKGLGQLVVGQ